VNGAVVFQNPYTTVDDRARNKCCVARDSIPSHPSAGLVRLARRV
jgi:hypothetical protein